MQSLPKALQFPIIALVTALFTSITPSMASAVDDSDQAPKILLSRLQIADEGNSIGISEFHIELSMKNQRDNLQRCLVVIEVRNNETGITESLQVVDRALIGAESTNVTSAWVPEGSGRYEIRAFAISNLTNPEVLSALTSKMVVVNITGKIITYSYPNEPFTIVLLPDTQNYWRGGNEEIAYNQSKWIVENKGKLNMQLVIHLGDIVNIWNNQKQWEMSDKMMSILDVNSIPYIVLVGNHDFGNPYSPTLSRDFSLFERYFPDSRIISNQTLQGTKITADAANMYTYLTVGANEFLVVSMEYCPTLDVIEQVNDVIRQNGDKRIILATHAFLRTDGSWTSVSGGGVCTKIPGTDDYSTEAIWDLVVYPNPNVFLVVSGHSSGENKRIDSNVAGNPVYQVVIDYQYKNNGGDGMLKIITFEPERDKIRFQTYSPWLDSYVTRDRSQFTFDYDMD